MPDPGLSRTDIGEREWIEWKGGKCPVPSRTRVGVKYRDGFLLTKFAGDCGWSHNPLNSRFDIVAYRVLSPLPSSHRGADDGQ